MVHYSFKKEDSKNRIKNIVLFYAVTPIIIGIICLMLAIYFLVIGIVVDSEAFSYGVPCLVFVIILIVLCLRCYYSVKKQFDSMCVSNSEDSFDYCIYKDKGLMFVEEIHSKRTTCFSASDVQRVCWNKSTIIVMLKSKKFLDFPQEPEIRLLLKEYIQ